MAVSCGIRCCHADTHQEHPGFALCFPSNSRQIFPAKIFPLTLLIRRLGLITIASLTNARLAGMLFLFSSLRGLVRIQRLGR